MPQGTIKNFNAERGFGFIMPIAGGEDVFFHISALTDQDEPRVGDRVDYDVGTDSETGRSRAVEVRRA